MISTEFGIIDDFREDMELLEYEPEKYHCVAIDDALVKLAGMIRQAIEENKYIIHYGI